MLPADKHVATGYFKNGMAQGVVSCYIIAIVVGLFVTSIPSKTLLCIGLSIVAALVTAVAHYYSAKEHWQDNDIQHQRAEHEREQIAIRNIGIPDDILEQLQRDMEAEQSTVEAELDNSAFEKSKVVAESFYLFSGITIAAILGSVLLAVIANSFWIFTLTMTLLKFIAECWKQGGTGIAQITKRSLLATLVTIPLLALLYLLLLQLLK